MTVPERGPWPGLIVAVVLLAVALFVVEGTAGPIICACAFSPTRRGHPADQQERPHPRGTRARRAFRRRRITPAISSFVAA